MHRQRSDIPSVLWAILSLFAVTNRYAYCTIECTRIILMLPLFQPSVSSFVSFTFVILNHRPLWCTDHFRPIFLIKGNTARYALRWLTLPTSIRHHFTYWFSLLCRFLDTDTFYALVYIPSVSNVRPRCRTYLTGILLRPFKFLALHYVEKSLAVGLWSLLLEHAADLWYWDSRFAI